MKRTVRIMGLDIGTQVTGIAYTVFANNSYKIEPVCQVKTSDVTGILCEIRKADCVVVGWPYCNKDLEIYIVRLVKEMQQYTAAPFLRESEHLSTVKSMNLLHNIDPRLANSKSLQDQVAACITLRNFIESLSDINIM